MTWCQLGAVYVFKGMDAVQRIGVSHETVQVCLGEDAVAIGSVAKENV